MQQIIQEKHLEKPVYSSLFVTVAQAEVQRLYLTGLQLSRYRQNRINQYLLIALHINDNTTSQPIDYSSIIFYKKN